MKRILVKTEDGSSTLFVPELGEHYHSIHGAITESEHIYISAALNYCLKAHLRVLEFGMGTGLNAYLTCLHSGNRKSVFYHTIEKYPLNRSEYLELYPEHMQNDSLSGIFTSIHECRWGISCPLSETFTIFKEESDFREAAPEGQYDVIYFDAFAPEVQPELWSREMFNKVYELAAPGAVLTTYSSKGEVRRKMVSAGFKVEKLPGPPGKREFLRAVK